MAIDVLIGALVGGAAAEGVSALTSKTKSPSASAPALPNQNTANTDAASTVATSRAQLLYSGGVTDETGGLGILTGSDVSTSSLVGG